MPTVTYQRPDAIGPALSGVAGAFAGEAEGRKFVEDTRRFDTTHQENVRQFDTDMKFRIQQLQVMRAENKLDREQQQMLQHLEQRWTSGENVLGREHEVGIQKRDITSKEKINTEQLRQSDVENKRNVGVQHRRITVDDENFEAEYRQRNEQLKDNQFRLNTVGQIRLKYPEAKPGTPAYEAAKLEYLQTVSAPGSTTGQQGVQQLTPEERGAFEQQFDTLFPNYDKEVARQVGELKTLAGARAEVEADAEIRVAEAREGRGVSGLPDTGKRIKDLTLIMDKTRIQEGTGDYPLNVDEPTINGEVNPLYEYRDEWNEIDTLIVDNLATAIGSAPFDITSGVYGSQIDIAMSNARDEAFGRIDRMTKLDPEMREQLKQYVYNSIGNSSRINDPGAPTQQPSTEPEQPAPTNPQAAGR